MRPLHFESFVPQRKREELSTSYESFTREYFISLLDPGIQTALQVWVEMGNDPYHSNRYGFYDCENLRYLNFFEGELKLCQLLEIAAGKRQPADCALNQFGEPSPRSSLRKSAGLKRISETSFGIHSSMLLDQFRRSITKPVGANKDEYENKNRERQHTVSGFRSVSV